ncbi:hypothetical protein PYCCODRAFT_1422583 [Trametes coccinea BRFM310]|uniref:CCHC-type domain-containing protein n=1 Tax=Trametes coccinea (strain BRFM310) TaxID=1353009 RepID=A0A1Y2J022_TRAC3|nr:hypothetical protein PYCCODRAFT_1422583 [Trametes coccinea BRFM310]
MSSTYEARSSGVHSPTLGSDYLSSVSSRRSIVDMPMEGTKLAPRTFKGDPAQKCETVVDYCSRVVRETIQGFSAYRQFRWDELKENIRVFWNADLEDKRFRIRDLQVFVAHAKKQPIHEMKDWRRYLRRFIRIAGWLQGQGLYVPFRNRLEARLLLRDPSHDMATPFEPEEIRKAAEGLDVESDEPQEPERERSTRQRKSKPRSRKAQPEWKDDGDSDEEEFKEKIQMQPRKVSWVAKGKEETRAKKEIKGEEKEFDELVEQMKKLALSDPQYGLSFLKACSMKPMAADCLPHPQVNQSVPNHFEPCRMVPPRMSRPDPNRFLSQRPTGPMISGCYRCGEQGHIMGECPRIQEFLEKRQVLRDYRGRFTTPDGMMVRRVPEETWLQAFKRTMPDVHFVTYGSRLDEDRVEDDEESVDVMVYPVERAQRETRSYRKQMFDRGPSSYQDKGKQKEFTSSQKPSQTMAWFPMQCLTPVETQPQTFNPDKDVEMMEDRTQLQRQKKSSPAPVVDRTRVPAKASQITVYLCKEFQFHHVRASWEVVPVFLLLVNERTKLLNLLFFFVYDEPNSNSLAVHKYLVFGEIQHYIVPSAEGRAQDHIVLVDVHDIEVLVLLELPHLKGRLSTVVDACATTLGSKLEPDRFLQVDAHVPQFRHYRICGATRFE